jgi:hypothetical protein
MRVVGELHRIARMNELLNTAHFGERLEIFKWRLDKEEP